MKRILLPAYLLAVHLLLGWLLWARLAAEPPHVREMQGILKWRDETTPAGSAVFLGDSLTERMAVVAVAPRAVNFGVGRSRSDQLFIPKAAHTAARIYLLTGTNDFLQGRQAGIEARLRHIAEILPRDVPLVWTGIMLPEAEGANRIIASLCAARPQCTYVEPVHDPALFVDGVHLTLAGYREWASRLRQATP